MHRSQLGRTSRLAARGLVVVLALAAAPYAGTRADEVEGEAPSLARDRTHLLSITPPVAGYSSLDGIVYNAAPLSYEYVPFRRAGLRLTSSVVVYRGTVQGYGLLLGVPLYLRAPRPGYPPGGLYAAPLVAALVDRLPRTRGAVRAGAEVGYARTFAERWRFSVGLWSVLGSAGFGSSTGGLVLALGAWL